MATKYRLGVAGLVHDHVWKELGYWKELPQVELAAAADPHAPLREKIAQEFGVEQTFESVEEMLEQVDLDILQVCTNNADHVPVVSAAAERGLHCVIEKPMADSFVGADVILQVARQNNIKLAINWPVYWNPTVQQAMQMVRQEAFGQVFHARVRMAHEGPKEMGCSEYFYGWLYDASQNGGGALVDYCCYGAAIFRELFGRPNSVTGVAARLVKQDIDVEDNASITVLYDSLMGVAEASWTQIPWYHDAMFLGTNGTLWTQQGKLFLDQSKHGDSPQEIECEPLPEGRRNCPELFMHCLENDEPVTGLISPEVGLGAQEILDAGLKSVEAGQRIDLSD